MSDAGRVKLTLTFDLGVGGELPVWSFNSFLSPSLWQMWRGLKVPQVQVQVSLMGTPSEAGCLPSPAQTRTRVWVPHRGSASLPAQDLGHQVPRPPTSTTSTSHRGPTRRPTRPPSCLRLQVRVQSPGSEPERKWTVYWDPVQGFPLTSPFD